MKENKFRAWDGDKYISPDYIDNNGHAYMHEQYEPPYKIEVVILEQFTGLHDKNGREIYEGDIVAVGVPDSGNIHNTSIVFRGCGFRLDKGHGALLISANKAGNIEVIGNIHETP